MDLGLEGKRAVVLASTSGLGLAVARVLAAEGARVAISGRDEARLEAALAELGGAGSGRLMGAALDVTDAAALAAHLDAVVAAWGPVEILVANAGGPPPGIATDTDDADWQRAFELTLMSAVRAIRHVLPGMRSAQWGRILALTSLAVRQPVAGLVYSNALRAGLTGFLKTLSTEVAADGVLVNSICTGLFATDRLGDLMARRAAAAGCTPEEMRARSEATLPIGRFGDPDELGTVAAFLVSPRCSYATGVALALDGGATGGLL